MIHNAWAEMGANAKLFYDAFRGLCKMRIAYAKCMIETLEDSYDTRGIHWDVYEKPIKFWTKVQDYWKKKLELSYQWEKDYFGHNDETVNS